MSIFYNMLRQKAGDPKYKDEIVVIGRFHFDILHNYFGMTYAQLLVLVDSLIERFRDPEQTIQPIEGRKKYIIIDNSITSLASIIALLECGAIPVIIDAKNIFNAAETILPYFEFGENYEPENKNEKIDNNIIEYLIHLGIAEVIGDNQVEIVDTMEGENEPGAKMIILSGGSEKNAPHLNLIKEADLANLPTQYGEDGEVFFSYISCANISGLLTNIVNFLKHDNRLLLTQNFDLELVYFANDYNAFQQKAFERKYVTKRYLCSTANPALISLLFYKQGFDGIHFERTHIEDGYLVIDEKRPDYQFLTFGPGIGEAFVDNNVMKATSMMLPRNILDYLETADLDGVDLSTMRHIYMAGGMNSEEVVKKMREKAPSIPEGVFTNLYGSTEANGVICFCNEKDFKTCYINISEYDTGKIYYTFDKRTFYVQENGAVREILPSSDLFHYMPYLTVSSKREKDVTVAADLSISYQGRNTGDVGVYINNQLYVLGRRSELVKLNQKYYMINSMESYFTNRVGSDVNVYPVDGNTIQPFLIFDRAKVDDNLIKKYEIMSHISKEIADFKVNFPCVIDRAIYGKSKISGKLSRAVLEQYIGYAERQRINFENIEHSRKEISRREVVKWFALYKPRLLADGSFIVDVSARNTIPSSDICQCFYDIRCIGNDIVLFIPKPEIIFMMPEHGIASSAELLVDAIPLGNFLLNIALKAYKTGEARFEKYIPPEFGPDAEAIITILKHNILYDVVRRALTRRLIINYGSVDKYLQLKYPDARGYSRAAYYVAEDLFGPDSTPGEGVAGLMNNINVNAKDQAYFPSGDQAIKAAPIQYVLNSRVKKDDSTKI